MLLKGLRGALERLEVEQNLNRLRRSPQLDLGPPLVFHHVPKTGGTSLIHALKAMTPARLRFSQSGNLSRLFIDRLAAAGFRTGQLIYGHPFTGAMAPLRGRARIVTLLREPRAQVISNYLWLREHPHLSDHRLALDLSLRDFLLSRPYFAVFQTASLDVGVEERPMTRLEDLADRSADIHAYLEEMALVGVTEALDPMIAGLAHQTGAQPSPTPHLRRNRLPDAIRRDLEAQVAEAEALPELAHLFAIERATYDKARSLAPRA